jgi:hypothetical protein
LGDLKNILSGIAAFQHLILRRSLGQLTTSFGGFLATCAAMDLCLTISLWITLPLSVLAAGFLVRIFIIQHDCGHGHEWGGKRDEARRNGEGPMGGNCRKIPPRTTSRNSWFGPDKPLEGQRNPARKTSCGN